MKNSKFLISKSLNYLLSIIIDNNIKETIRDFDDDMKANYCSKLTWNIRRELLLELMDFYSNILRNR